MARQVLIPDGEASAVRKFNAREIVVHAAPSTGLLSLRGDWDDRPESGKTDHLSFFDESVTGSPTPMFIEDAEGVFDPNEDVDRATLLAWFMRTRDGSAVTVTAEHDETFIHADGRPFERISRVEFRGTTTRTVPA